LFKDLDRLLDGAGKYIASALDRFARVSTGFLVPLEFEFAFYLNAVKLIRRIRGRGLPMCRPDIAPIDERVFVVDELYELNLALRMAHKRTESDLHAVIVTNQVEFGPAGRIFILTGPNQGGKTTYTQAVGVAQVLAQAGLHVPGTQARISPVDGIYTHFPVEERLGMEAGRVGVEAQRLSDIFGQATGHSLVLMNESLASTSEGESLYLAQDVVRGLKLLGLRAIFATHLHPLAERIDTINTESPGDSRLISMVAGITGVENGDGEHGVRRTYKIQRGPPIGHLAPMWPRHCPGYRTMSRKRPLRNQW
jgi:DNA mismatch repair ATPase MutS